MSKRNSGAALFVADRVDRTLGSDAVHRKEACDRSDQQADSQQQKHLTRAEMEQRHQNADLFADDIIDDEHRRRAES